MRKRNNTKQLGRNHAHRKAMLRNMATSFFDSERIKSTKAKVKTLQPIVERMITRAKKTLADGITQERILHHKRELLKIVKDRGIVTKLCDDIAKRYTERNGGYTRVLNTVNRVSDNTKMAIIELVEKKEKILVQEDRKLRRLAALPKKKREKLKAAMTTTTEKPKDKKKEKKSRKKVKK
jgi:large subunit ribosomal protein L17